MHAVTPLPPGALLAEYRIDAVLGSGTFAITYRATDTHLGMNVAIKEFCPAELVMRDAGNGVRLRDESQAEYFRWCMERFVGEGQVLAQFKHPNIVRVSRYFAANGTAYIVMDYEEGRSLASLLEREGQPIDEARLLRIFLPLLEGLAEVHRKRWLHRDIKPGNIFLRADDSPILLDFGAAEHAMRRRDEEATVLTPGYAPVEQYSTDGHESPATDLYALGATMYRCVTGNRPVDAARRLAMLHSGQPDPLVPTFQAAGTPVSLPVLEAIDDMLRLEQAERPDSAESIIARLLPTAPARRGGAGTDGRGLPRLLFTGPVGAGKRTALATLGDAPPVSVDADTANMPGAHFGAAAGSMEYAVLGIAGDERIEMFATRGQERSERMREALRERTMGLVLLLDNTRLSPFRDLDFYLTAFRDLISETRVVIGVTHMNEAPLPSIADYHRHLRDNPTAGAPCVNPPVFAVDARERDDMAMLVQALAYSLDPALAEHEPVTRLDAADARATA